MRKLAWRDWPLEIPDSFVLKFAAWSAENGVKGKYSIVPYPGCVGRIDRMLPGWTQAELEQSIDLVRREITAKLGHPSGDGDAYACDRSEDWSSLSGLLAKVHGELGVECREECG
jgi:hypothetical protein